MNELRDFIGAYRKTWEDVMNGTSDIHSLTPFFNLPCMMLSSEGAVSWHREADEIQVFNESRRDAFRSGGAVKAALRGVDVTTLGSHAAQINVNWELSRDDGSIERAWRHYYILARPESAWKIVLSAFQLGS